jgi:hypothetical protein
MLTETPVMGRFYYRVTDKVKLFESRVSKITTQGFQQQILSCLENTLPVFSLSRYGAEIKQQFEQEQG